MPTCGELVVRLLERYGVRHVFGLPGIHNLELYRGLAGSPIRHVAPRHEQGAGFMADGYAPASGEPGICFVVSGPGVTNIATAMGQAYADSVPMLVISSVNERGELGTGNGHLHELASQSAVMAGVSAFSHTLLDPRNLPQALGRAFAVMKGARPRPTHIEIPVDVLAMAADDIAERIAAVPSRPAPAPSAVAAAAGLLAASRSPLLVAGGGAADAADACVRLAGQLDMPVVTTINGKGILPPDHPLLVHYSPAMTAVQDAIAAADVVLAVGTELGPTDFGSRPGTGSLVAGKLIRIDIDPLQTARNALPDLAIPADARLALEALAASPSLARPGVRDAAGPARARTIAARAEAELSATARGYKPFMDAVVRALPDAIVVGDSTRAVYAANRFHAAPRPRSWFNAATGFGTLGFALPAAIGAKLAAPTRPVVCIAGDGGFQFSVAELASAVEAQLTIAVIVWNDEGFGAIRSAMAAQEMPAVAVDPWTPDLLGIARACGCLAMRPQTIESFETALADAQDAAVPTVIELRPAN